MSLTEDPWQDIAPSPKVDLVNAKRVDATLPYGFFWAKGMDRRCLLLLQHKASASNGLRFPKLNGIDVALNAGDINGQAVLSLRLQDGAQRELFHRLCLDLVKNAGSAPSEGEAVTSVLSRMWRWHHLLRGGGDSRLSAEEQKGLLGELSLLKRLCALMSAADAVKAWRGPLDAPKDFEVGKVAIEAKARRGAASPYVTISSEFQLDPSGLDSLFLYVADLAQMPAAGTEGQTLTEVANEVRQFLLAVDPGAAADFDALLASAGFRWEDDYSEFRWSYGQERLYRIAAGFPSVIPGFFSPGVSNICYSVALPSCEEFLLPIDGLASYLRGESDGQRT